MIPNASGTDDHYGMNYNELNSSFPNMAGNGLNPSFDETVHLLATEPAHTFLRVAVMDGEREAVYETAVLGRCGSLQRRVSLALLLPQLSHAATELQATTASTLQAARCKLRAACCTLHTASCEPQAARCTLHAAS